MPESMASQRRMLVTASVMLATVMQTLDTTIANVALPYMQGSLSAAQDQISWVLTSYIVAAAIATPLTGWFVARFGRKQIFLLSVAGFTISSMLCGAATGLGEIVAFRLLQGVFGASLVPLSQAVILDINPPEGHGRAMAIWGAAIMIGPILGPALGGWLTDHYNWRWVFYINVPVGIVAFAGMALFLDETERKGGAPFDLFGFAFLSLGLAALQIMLDRGEQKDWFGSTEIVIEAALAIIGFWVFAAHSATAKRPFLDPGLLKDRNFVAATLLMFAAGIILYATLALLPPMLTLLDYPVVTTGLLTAPRGVTTMICMILVGRLIGKVDVRLILAFGFIAMGFSLWEMTGYSPQMDRWPVIIAGLVQGVGLGFVIVPLSTAAFSSLAPALRTEGTALYSLMRNIGGSIGISVSETVLQQGIQTSHEDLVQHITPFNHALQLPAPLHYWSMHSVTGLARLDQLANFQAAVIAYLDDYKLMMLVCFLVLPLVLLLRPTGRKAGAAAVLE